MEDAMRNAVTNVLDGCLQEITHTLDGLKGMKNDIRLIKDSVKNIEDDIRGMKQDIRDVKEDIRDLMVDVGLVARTAALVSFHSDYTR